MHSATSFFWYDLETSGLSGRKHRIMQFAGQRTNMQLQPVGEPVNVLIKMTDDTLPDVDSVLITGITPQMTLADGLSEAEFLDMFTREIATPGTIFAGYNTVRFDDEFMRCLHYRNFYDPYEWQWQDGRSRWDLLDMVRMTRALRPEGIQWPFDLHGKPTNRLELLTALNKLEHTHAHDAQSDVYATIAVAAMIQSKQPKLFEYLLDMRDKKKVAALVEAGEPFVYTSGKYASEFEKTTAALHLGKHPKKQGVLVFDLRHDPTPWFTKTPAQLAEAWRWKKDSDEPRLPVKTLQYNRCPAVAPMGVLDGPSRERLKLDFGVIARHAALVRAETDFYPKLLEALELLEKGQQASPIATEYDVDAAIYDGFMPDADKQLMRVVRAAQPDELGALNLDFRDTRLTALLPLYKARNFPKFLSPEERQEWERYRTHKLIGGGQHSQMGAFAARLQELAAGSTLTGQQQYLLEELKLYAESIMPETE